MTKRSLPLVATRLFGCPLAIEPDKLQAIVDGLGPRLLGMEYWGEDERPSRERKPYAVDGSGIATIPGHGVLVQRGGWCDAESAALTGYDGLGQIIAAAVADTAVKGILLDVDSPGGEVAGCAELAKGIRAAAKVKPVIAVANEAAYSAAYWLASGVSEIWLPATAGVGSIGVIAIHLDRSGEEKQAGLKYTAIYSGERKNDLSPHEPLSATAKADLQARVDDTRGLFAADVAKGRRIPVDAVLATEAACFAGEAAIAAGLADRIGNLEQARSALAARVSRAGPGMRAAGPVATLRAGKEPMAIDAQAPEPGADTVTLAVATPDPKVIEAAEKAGAEKAQAAVKEIADLCAIAGRPDRVAAFVAEGATPDAVRKALLAERHAALEENPIRTMQVAGSGGASGDKSTNYGWDRIARKAGAHRFAPSAA